MNVAISQKLQDFHNTRILLEKKESQWIYAENGRLKLRAGFQNQSEAEAREVKELISSLLARVEVGIGPLTAPNVQSFVFDHIFPLHPSICDPSAMQKNPVLRDVIAKRVEELKPEIAKDINIVRCAERIQEIDNRIAQVQRQRLNPVYALWNSGVQAVGGKADQTLERELAFLHWRKGREEKYCAALTEALLGLKMNLSHETGAEKNRWSGSFLWRSYLTNRKIGIYKPSDQDSLSPRSPYLGARLRYNLIPASNGILVSQSEKSHIAETGARIAGEVFHQAYLEMKSDGIEMPFTEMDTVVPDTRIVEMNFSSGPTKQGIGSFQLFLKRCLPLTEAFGIDKRTFQPKARRESAVKCQKFLPQFQWLKLLHYVIFALDDHAENTLATLNADGQEVVALKAIDNGQSLPAAPLENGFIENAILSIKPLHGLKHPLAKHKILPFFREFLRRFISEGYLDLLAKQLYDLYQDPRNYPDGKTEQSEITAGRIRLLRERFSVLERLFVIQEEPLNVLLQFPKGNSKK